jgi:hypothetical protein
MSCLIGGVPRADLGFPWDQRDWADPARLRNNVGGSSYPGFVSLTGVLAGGDHPGAVLLRKQLPRTAAVRAAYRAALPVSRARRPVATDHGLVRWDLLGRAVDQRIRCAFTVPAEPGPVVSGVYWAARLGGARLGDLGAGLVGAYMDLLRSEQPHQRGRRWVLAERAEALLARLCFAMGWFEEIYRSPQDGIPEGSPLAHAQDIADVEGLLALVPGYALEDLAVQVRVAERGLGALRENSSAEECTAGPVFDGSADVGGADADLLVADSLIEIKAALQPDRLSDSMIWQLAGYLLLDYSDRWQIRRVGFYLSRIGWLMAWPVEEFLDLLGAGTSLPVLRERFAACVGARGARHRTGSGL